MSLRWSLASQQIMGGGCIHRAFYRLSRPVFPFEGRFVGGMLLPGVCLFLRAGRNFPSSRYITGTFYYSNRSAVLTILFDFKQLRQTQSS